MRVNERQSGQWLGIPCDSDAWPYSADIAVFEARRAVGQLVRTLGSGLNPPGLEAADVDPVLRHVRAVNVMETVLKDVQRDLIAEARAHGLAWAAIGRVFGVGGHAIQNRFGAGLSDGRLGQLKVEAMVAWMARQAATPHEVLDEIAVNLSGATPVERIEYLARHALGTMLEIDELLTLAESERENALPVLKVACRKIERVVKAVAADHAMWDAVAGWSGRSGTVDQANYHAPATYLLHAMRLLVSALLYAPEEKTANIDDCRTFLTEVKQAYATVLLLFERDDVGSAVPWDEDRGTGAS